MSMWFWLFLVSIFINIFLMFYVKWLFKSLEVINMDIESLLEKINNFSTHLTEVHEMEMFYGDQTLQTLMQHATELSSDILNLDLLLNAPLEQQEEIEFEEKKKTQNKE